LEPLKEELKAIKSSVDGLSKNVRQLHHRVDAVAEKLKHHVTEMFYAPRMEILSNREQEIMDLLCQGLNMKEIAAKLCISKHTAASHQTNIHRKLGVRDKGQLLRLCHLKTEKPSNC